MPRNELGICSNCKKKRKIHIIGKRLCRKCYDSINRDRINEVKTEWGNRNQKKVKRWANNFLFGGNRDLVLERDNWECQECGMSQEKCIVIFNRGLSIHHRDENGLNVSMEDKNNNIDNLMTLCTRCHSRLHRNMNKKRKFGFLLDQDDSEYKYPKIREILDSKKKKLGTITKAKKELASELGLTHHAIDHMCYERKEIID